MHKIRIGSGAGYSGDRIEPALELARLGQLNYLAFECLGERTIALAQAARLDNPEAGYDPLLGARMEAVLRPCAEQGVKIITNMGAANPTAAARFVAGIARKHGFAGLKVAAVTGDDVIDVIRAGDYPLLERRGTTRELSETMVSANAYLGADGIVEALRGGADVVITGRVGDPALFLAPMIHEFGWPADDWSLLAKGVAIGHLLECAGQVTGGYFADPGFKDVPNLARLGFPLAEVSSDGSAVLTKVSGSGGRISVASCKEQLLYEILDPSAYLQADVTSDFSAVTFTELGADRIAISGATGRKAPEMLKVSIGYRDGFIGEGQMSYAGPGALERAQLALEIVRERLNLIGVRAEALRFDVIGFNASNLSTQPANDAEPREVRIRVAGRTRTLHDAQRIGAEVETLYTNGPAGGGGATQSTRALLPILSTLIPRDKISIQVDYEVA